MSGSTYFLLRLLPYDGGGLRVEVHDSGDGVPAVPRPDAGEPEVGGAQPRQGGLVRVHGTVRRRPRGRRDRGHTGVPYGRGVTTLATWSI
ncbi:hypothetical protein [Streptomyces carpinensis]|uniref:hypothetical protein n=1 Tax=Streptomyces carpinensis TaxID=66369 RepID=UPI003CC675B7